ncbi:helix-turn-helix domain-containing protein [Streptomyces buecherae]|uniref:Helix-turn-helix transcriptional regulator n=1 Tax=Streptomyces buecherae TaxID=2763006 RepID=A0A7H8N885_9ACTN|nr:helix-turn-helix transcriptional regulator [Streptomyces buecherae]QKW50717.1 helix-turn-helix transcriptional regulator [Streptomyces buecherae]
MELHDDDYKMTPNALIERQLRRYRETANLSQRGLAEAIGYPASYISRVERGEQLPSQALGQALDDHFHTGGLFVDLVCMAQETLVATYSQAFIAQESRAARIEVFASSLVPGLFQTPAYARELMVTGLPAALMTEVEHRVQIRMDRQKLFEREPPPHVWAVMDEAALKRPTADRTTMADQLRQLIRRTEEAHTQVQVVPFGQAFHPFLGGSLTLLTMPEGRKTCLVESFAAGTLIDTPRDLIDLEQRFDVVRSQALSPTDSVQLVRSYLEAYA